MKFWNAGTTHTLCATCHPRWYKDTEAQAQAAAALWRRAFEIIALRKLQQLLTRKGGSYGACVCLTGAPRNFFSFEMKDRESQDSIAPVCVPRWN